MALAEASSRYAEGAAAAAERLDPLSRFTCPVCLEVFKSPVKVPCDQAFKECLKPKEPVCGVCHSTLSHGSRALEVEKQIEMTVVENLLFMPKVPGAFPDTFRQNWERCAA